MTPVRTEIAHAKVNLALHVRRRRDDGYHLIETVFAFCEDGDVVRAEHAEATSLTIDGPFGDGLSTKNNLVVLAADALGITAKMHLTKNLPVASGIGGGSADAAAVLRLLGCGRRDLVRVAATLGADVPACVSSVTARGEGVGEVLTAAPSVTGTPILLVNPNIALSTASVFHAWDGIDRGPLGGWRDGRNDLEAPAVALVPQIGALLGWLNSRHDVTIARMSGSGATCFALFDGVAARDRVAAELKTAFPQYWTMASVLR